MSEPSELYRMAWGALGLALSEIRVQLPGRLDLYILPYEEDSVGAELRWVPGPGGDSYSFMITMTLNHAKRMSAQAVAQSIVDTSVSFLTQRKKKHDEAIQRLVDVVANAK